MSESILLAEGATIFQEQSKIADTGCQASYIFL